MKSATRLLLLLAFASSAGAAGKLHVLFFAVG